MQEPLISRATFDEQRKPRFGTANPTRMQMEFWEWMIRGDDVPPDDARRDLGRSCLTTPEGMIKSRYGPYRARNLFQVPLNRDDGPIWTFDRMGSTRTELPDGRVVCVGGEHEDHYDPDFCIYNDVVVFAPGGRIEIYGYPRDVFPPTDFHTASLTGGRILLVGCLGYPEERRPGQTPVYALDPGTYCISPVATYGPNPGWLFEHEATVGPDGSITVSGGKVIEERDGRQRTRRNVDDFSLDPVSGVWLRRTDRQWRQFSIQPAGGDWMPMEPPLEAEGILPVELPGAEMPSEPTDDGGESWFRVQGCLVSVSVGLDEVEVVVRGSLPAAVAAEIADAVRARVEALIQRPCIVEPL